MENPHKKQRCNYENCTKRKRDKQSGFCTKHGGGFRCTEKDCTKSARNKNGKCKLHNGGIRCSFEGCNKSAVDGYKHCKQHNGGVRCDVEGCTKSARGKSNKCVVHGGQRCSVEGCTKATQGKGDKCISHNGGTRCSVEGCKRLSRGKPGTCPAHGGKGRCIVEGCVKRSQGKSDKCGSHKGGLRCPNCIDWIDSRCGSKKYDNYCATCFKYLFPNDPRSLIKYAQTKEIRVRNFINQHFDGFIHDKPLYTDNCDCSLKRRIDHRKLINGTMLAIETDEFAHRGYDPNDEEIRYDDLYMGHSGKYIYIRFNPDGGKIDMEDKLEILRECIETQIDRIENDENTELVEIIKLFY
jgi:hypothetical protein